MQAKLVPVRTYDEELDGAISIIEQAEFPIKRVFWITDLYTERSRANHAHKKLRQFIVAVHGHCKIKSFRPDGGFDFFKLSSPNVGLDVPPGNWLHIYDFDRQTAILVLASESYDPEDYIHKPEEFFQHGIPDTF